MTEEDRNHNEKISSYVICLMLQSKTKNESTKLCQSSKVVALGIGVYSNARWLRVLVSVIQSRDSSLALTKNDLIFLVLNASIREGNGMLLKQWSCWFYINIKS